MDKYLETFLKACDHAAEDGLEAREIILSQGKVALVDAEDFDYLNQWKWCYTTQGYAMRQEYPSKKFILMHRFINKTPEGMYTDHRNGNRLDNRKSNLRTSTANQNAYNSRTRRTNTSGIKGVRWRKDRNKWAAILTVNYKNLHLGHFDNKFDAKKARDRKITELELAEWMAF